MSFSGGVYTLPGPALVTGEVVSATENNQFRNDVAGAFNLTFLRNGTSTATANLPMGGYKLTGLGVATTSGDALSYGQAAVVSDITATGSITVNSGTANGVAYLNGSKVLTTGSALTFDGTNLVIGAGGTGSSTPYLNINGGSGANGGSYIRFNRNGVTTSYIGTDSAINGGTSDDLDLYASSNLRFFSSNSEQMRLTSTGLGIGTSSPNAKFAVQTSGADGINLMVDTAAPTQSCRLFLSNSTAGQSVALMNISGSLTFRYAATPGSGSGSEAMRIDSSGNLLVGKTSADYTTKGVWINTYGIVNSATDNSSDFWNSYNTVAGAYRFYVSKGGTVFATSTTISAISDRRFKENVSDLNVGLAEVLALKPRKFDWKAGKGKDIKNDRGFIAQEFEQVFPDLIDEWKDPAPEGEEPYKSVRQDLIPVLVKAIQELKAELDATKAEVAELKGN